MELPFVGDAINSFISGFLSIVATIFALMVCLVCRFRSTICTRARDRPIIPVGRRRNCSQNSAGLLPAKEMS